MIVLYLNPAADAARLAVLSSTPDAAITDDQLRDGAGALAEYLREDGHEIMYLAGLSVALEAMVLKCSQPEKNVDPSLN